MIWFDKTFVQQAWGGQPPNEQQVFALQGEIYRQQPGRKTLRFERAGRSYFVKLHWPVGWREILKNLFSFRLPILGARNEYQAIRLLHEHALATMTAMAFAEYGSNPLRQKSFLITEDLSNTISLEDYCESWGEQAPDYRIKRLLTEELADISRRMHAAGLNHRDYYLCHFLMPNDNPQLMLKGERPHLHLIDLHRAQIRKSVPKRWLVKDLGSLYFSALDAGLSQRDVLRFIRAYEKQRLRKVLSYKRAFYRAVKQRAEALYVKAHGQVPKWPL